jgi:hypothetical protein
MLMLWFMKLANWMKESDPIALFCHWYVISFPCRG